MLPAMQYLVDSHVYSLKFFRDIVRRNKMLGGFSTYVSSGNMGAPGTGPFHGKVKKNGK